MAKSSSGKFIQVSEPASHVFHLQLNRYAGTIMNEPELMRLYYRYRKPVNAFNTACDITRCDFAAEH
jgi:hypothetical protein